MTEEKKKLHGFAGIVSKQIEPLNEMEKFKQKFKDTEVKVLLNAKDGKWAALLILDKGKIFVEGIKNNPKENIKKKNAGWDGLLQTTTASFLELLGGDNVSTGKVIRKILTGKIKIRGIKHVLVLLQLFDL
ncbi:MAG: hypothetical protein E3J52_09205 [Promethearchaeota archaeon]|nr:MAG: hypothetical protein E3J52_09205 [Candidatus Lokiarchaeota archaeon]